MATAAAKTGNRTGARGPLEGRFGRAERRFGHGVKPPSAGSGRSLRVGIVGAGPTGLTLACALARGGVPVSIVDASPGPERESSRATTIHAGTLEALDRLDGIGVEIARAAALARKSYIWAGSHRLATVHWDRMPTRYAALPNMRQAEIEAILRGRLSRLGVEVEWDRTVADPGEIDATFVIGCDGSRSTIRRSIGVELVGESLDGAFMLADVRLAGDVDHQTANLWVSTAGVLSILPLPRGWFRLNGTLADGEPFDAGSLSDAMARRMGVVSARVDVEVVAWAASYRTHARLATGYRRGRVLLAGDAAHLNSPVLGQGMNVGIGDALNLGERLTAIHHGAPRELLDEYETTRRPVAQRVLRISGQATAMVTARRPVERLLRNQVLRVGHRLPPVQRRMSTVSAFMAQGGNAVPLVAGVGTGRG